MVRKKPLTLKERIRIAKDVGRKSFRRAKKFGVQAKARSAKVGKKLEKFQMKAAAIERASAKFAKEHPSPFGDDLFEPPRRARKRKRRRRDELSFF